MTNPVPSKEQIQPCPHGRTPDLCRQCMRDEIAHLRRENVRWENAHKILLSENERLRKQVGELSIHAEKWVKRALKPAHEREPPHCSTCACGIAPEPGALRRAAEPHTCECSACYEMRAIINGTAQPPGDG